MQPITSSLPQHISSQEKRLDPRVESALKQVDAVALQTLHNQGVCMEGTNNYGYSALSIASRKNSQSLLKTLLAWGRSIDETDSKGEVPLLAAVRSNPTDTLILIELLRLGSNINHQNREGTFALLLATADENWPIFSYLLSQNANPLLETKTGNTALKQAVYNKNMQMISALLLQGAHPQMQDQCKQENAFMIAAEVGFTGALELFINRGICKQGVDIDTQDIHGNTALHRAIIKNNIHVLNWLINHNANVNLANTYQGETPLMLAAKLGRYEIVVILVNKGADPRTVNLHGKTALMKTRNEQIKEYLQLL